MKRMGVTLLALLLAVGGLVACRLAWRVTPAQAALPASPALIARGQYLTEAADCMACHTGPGHAPFSGGLVIQTPFGSVASTNITPDTTIGIGGWSDKRFYKALHDGVGPGRDWLVFPHYLYPVMPYTAYTKLSYADVMAIKAYLDSLPPVKAPDLADHLRFPFNQRPVLVLWRALFFTPGPMPMSPTWSASVKNGAYLTEALGHCGACHTPRNFMQASIARRALAGAPLEGFFAPNISSSRLDGVGGWSRANLVAYLHAGGNNVTGSAYGPMRLVVENSTSKLPVADIEDMAAYLQQATVPQTTPLPAVIATARHSVASGAALYAENCAMCHGSDGRGMSPQIIPNLAGNGSLTAGQGQNAITAILAGLGHWSSSGPTMPAFGTQLSNQQIADVSNYLRTAWGNKGTASVTPRQVQRLREQMKRQGLGR